MSTANLDSADLKGALAGGLIREDVMDKIWDISKIPLPFTDMVSTGSCKNEYYEWTQDELAAPDITNAVIDGSDPSDNNTALGTRVGNHCQISDKVVRVSHRANASSTIGRAKELAYQLMRRQQELKRDVDAICLVNQASVQDNGSTVAGKAGGLPSWIKTTVVNCTAGGFNTSTKLTVANTPGAAAGLTEADIRNCIDGVYAEGGDPSVMMSTPDVIGAFAKYLFSSSAQVATISSDQGKSRAAAAALSAINVFITQHGTVRFVSNRLQQAYDDGGTTVADIFILDPAYIKLVFLEGYRTDTLSKTGLAENRMMSVDWTLMVSTEKAHAMIVGIDPTVAVSAS